MAIVQGKERGQLLEKFQQGLHPEDQKPGIPAGLWNRRKDAHACGHSSLTGSDEEHVCGTGSRTVLAPML